MIYKICKNCSDTFENTSFTTCEFPFIFFIFYTLFGSLLQNKPGRQDVAFVVLGHIYFVSPREDCDVSAYSRGRCLLSRA